MIKVEQDYLKDLVLSKICHKGNPLKKVESAVSKVAGSLTGGLIGRDPNKEIIREAKKEAERQEEQVKERIKEEKIARVNEEEFAKRVDRDKQALTDAEGKRVSKVKPELTSDFSKAVKNKDDEEEDKLKKSLRKAFRG